METTLEIEGMMCDGCARSVKQALEKDHDVTYVYVSHDNGRATIHHNSSLENLSEIIEEAGYKVITN